MLRTKQLREALIAHLTGTGLFDTVTPFNAADLSAALESLRDAPDSAAIVVPSRTVWDHTMIADGINTPAYTESRAEFELLITLRDLAHGDGGAPDAVDSLDDLTDSLLWADLGLSGLLTLPIAAEPIVIEIDERRGREAWKITLELRHTHSPL